MGWWDACCSSEVFEFPDSQQQKDLCCMLCGLKQIVLKNRKLLHLKVLPHIRLPQECSQVVCFLKCTGVLEETGLSSHFHAASCTGFRP